MLARMSPKVNAPRIAAWLALGLAGLGCRTPPQAEPDLERLARYLTGSFDSSAQAAADPDYRSIHLHMVPIFGGRGDGHWFYVEQAAASALDRPYRQRVYHLHAEPGGFVSDVYTLPGDPLLFAGAWRDPERLERLDPADLTPRDGCSIHLQARPDGSFEGSTKGTGCASELRGAQYATSRVVVDADLLASWDQGFDASGKQVWGAEKGPYLFVRH